MGATPTSYFRPRRPGLDGPARPPEDTESPPEGPGWAGGAGRGRSGASGREVPRSPVPLNSGAGGGSAHVASCSVNPASLAGGSSTVGCRTFFKRATSSGERPEKNRMISAARGSACWTMSGRTLAEMRSLISSARRSASTLELADSIASCCWRNDCWEQRTASAQIRVNATRQLE